MIWLQCNENEKQTLKKVYLKKRTIQQKGQVYVNKLMMSHEATYSGDVINSRVSAVRDDPAPPSDTWQRYPALPLPDTRVANCPGAGFLLDFRAGQTSAAHLWGR